MNLRVTRNIRQLRIREINIKNKRRNKMTIAEWVQDNAKFMMPDQHFSEEDLQHIIMCCEHLFEWATEGRPVGHFLTAVIDNDFIEACIKADDVNRKALYLYALFMLNRIPADKIRGRRTTT